MDLSKEVNSYLGVPFSRTISIRKESIYPDVQEGFILWAYVINLTLSNPNIRLFLDLVLWVRVDTLPAGGPYPAPRQLLPLGIASCL
jgi:hypothetical protein